jgi:hypothetical protein
VQPLLLEPFEEEPGLAQRRRLGEVTTTNRETAPQQREDLLGALLEAVVHALEVAEEVGQVLEQVHPGDPAGDPHEGGGAGADDLADAACRRPPPA